MFILKFSNNSTIPFLSDPGVPGVRSMGSSLSNWLTNTPFADLTDVTLADEDTNAILADDANGHSKAMWQCKWHNLVANFETKQCNWYDLMT